MTSREPRATIPLSLDGYNGAAARQDRERGHLSGKNRAARGTAARGPGLIAPPDRKTRHHALSRTLQAHRNGLVMVFASSDARGGTCSTFMPAIDNRAGTERGEHASGLVELDYSVSGEVEIVTFGVIPEETGTGAAHFQMEGALAHALAREVGRVWLHTCTFDHPAAVRFYRRHGFRGFKFAIEVSDDPRLSGLLPEDAAPHVPLIRP